MAALSDLRRQKLVYLFRILDVNHSGHIDVEDIERFVALLAQARYYPKDSLAFAALHHAYMHIWEALSAQIDTNKDGAITTEEWLAFFEAASDDPSFKTEFVRPIERTMVTLLDTDGDDRIRLSDYYALARACRLSHQEVDDVFTKIDGDGNGVLTEEEAGNAITQFFLSDDPNVPGNWFFGDYTRTV